MDWPRDDQLATIPKSVSHGKFTATFAAKTAYGMASGLKSATHPQQANSAKYGQYSIENTLSRVRMLAVIAMAKLKFTRLNVCAQTGAGQPVVCCS